MKFIKNPFVVTIKYQKNTKKTLSVHPRKSGKGKNSTMVDGNLKRNKYYYYDPTSEESYNCVLTYPCWTEINLGEYINEYIEEYNKTIKRFNDGVEKLKKKYTALYMLNSVGLKNSLI